MLLGDYLRAFSVKRPVCFPSQNYHRTDISRKPVGFVNSKPIENIYIARPNLLTSYA